MRHLPLILMLGAIGSLAAAELPAQEYAVVAVASGAALGALGGLIVSVIVESRYE